MPVKAKCIAKRFQVKEVLVKSTFHIFYETRTFINTFIGLLFYHLDWFSGRSYVNIWMYSSTSTS